MNIAISVQLPSHILVMWMVSSVPLVLIDILWGRMQIGREGEIYESLSMHDYYSDVIIVVGERDAAHQRIFLTSSLIRVGSAGSLKQTWLTGHFISSRYLILSLHDRT